MPTIPYAPTTHVDGNSFTATKANTLELGVQAVSLAPTVRVYHNTTQPIASDGAFHSLAFNSERFDQVAGAADTMHDTVTNNSRLTCRYAGVYLIGGHAVFAANATGVKRYSRLLLNNTTVIDDGTNGISHATEGGRTKVVTSYSLAVNDYVEFQVQQDSGGSLNVSSIGNSSPEFWMVRVG